MTRFGLITALSLAAGPAAAADLWCMPERLCRDGDCRPTQDEEASVRLRDFDAARPVLRSHAEDVPMRLTHDGATRQWQGRDAAGATQILAWRRQDDAFVYLRRLDGRDWTATGRCEVQ